MAYFVSNPTEPNYYFIDSVAYTEDHVPVKKLCWCDAPSKLKESTLCSYFELFGPVLEIKMFSNNSSMFQSGYVIYDNVKDAARALRTCNHKVNGIEFLVEASDSWDQPDAYGSSPEELQGPSLILGLNDYCLEHIMAKLELQDKVRFAKTCLRIRAIFKRESARLHTCVDLGQFRNMTVWDIRYYFQLFGAHIQVLYGKFEADHSERLAQFIRDYCRNLKSVQVVCSPGIGLHMHTIFANMNQLEELQLHNSDIADEPLLDLENLINLKKLTLSNNFLTGSTLAELPVSIEVLGLNECRDLEAKYLPEMCRRLPKLRELNIQNVNTSPLRVFKIMVTDNCCPSLEVLRVTAFPYTTYEFVPQLPKLKHLTICNPLTNYPAFTDSLCRILICELVKYKSEQLDHLEILGFPVPREQLLQVARLSGLRALLLHDTEVDDVVLKELANLKNLEMLYFRHNSESVSMIVHLFCGCPRLNHLRLNECDQPNPNLVRGIVTRVHQEIASKEDQRKLPIELWSSMNDKQINDFIQSVPDLKLEGIIQMKCTDDQ